MKKRILAIFLSVLMLLGTVMVPVAAANAGELPFTDVGAEKWYYDAVKYAYENELFKGTSDTTFEPEATMTRAMLVRVLYNHYVKTLNGVAPKITAENPFTDVKTGDWFYEPVLWAVENKITAGMGDNKFEPMAAVTREQIAKFVLNYVTYLDYDAVARKDFADFADSEAVSSWAVESLQWAVAVEIVSGTPRDEKLYLDPKENATRAQVASIMMRLESGFLAGDKHTVVVDAAVPATCTETGLTEGSHCSVCGRVFKAQEVIPALGHTPVSVAAKAPTCTEDGLTEGSYCSVCNEVLTAQTVDPALGHDLIHHEAQAAAPGVKGWEAYDTCSRCDYTTYKEIPALDWSDVATAKTLGGILPVGEAVFEDNAPRYYNFVESQTALSSGAISAVWAVADKNYTTLTLLVKLDNFDFDQDPTEAVVTVEVGENTYKMNLEGTKTGDFGGAVYNADGTDGVAAYYEFQVAVNGSENGKVLVRISYGADSTEKGYITLAPYTAYKTIDYQLDGKDVTCITRVYEAGEDGTLVIPKQLDGKYVVQLGDYNDDRVSILGDNPWVKTVRVQNPGESLQVELRKRVFAFTMLEKIIIDDDVVLNNGNALPEQFAYGSTKLQSVELPDTITAFGKEAFRNTPALKTVDLPSSLTYIGANCFRQAGLTGDIVIPATVTKIDYAAFYAVQTMSSVTVLNPDCEFITGGGQWDGHPFVATGSASLKGYLDSTLEAFCAANSLSDRFVPLNDYSVIATAKTLGGVLPVGEAVFEDNAPRYYNFVESQTSLSAGAISAVWAVADKNYTTLTLLVKLDNFDFDQDPTEAVVTVTVGKNSYALNLEGTKTGDFNGAVYNADGSDGAAAYYEFQVAINAAEGKKVAVAISYGSDKIEKGYITLSDYTAYKTIDYQLDGKDVTCITRVYEAGEDGTLVIPKEINGKPVVHMGDFNDDRVSILGDNPWVKTVRVQNPGEGFQVELRKRVFAFTMLEKIIIDDDVVLNNGNVLPEQFAYGSQSLKEVQIPDTITAFSKEAFRNCTALTAVAMPSNLTYIGANCFRSAGLTGDIVIPATVTKIDYAAFYAVQTMSSVTVLNPDCEFITGGGMWDGHPFVATGSASLKGYRDSTLEAFCAANSLSDRFVPLNDYSVIATAKTLGGILPVGEAVFEDNAPRYYNFVESQTTLSSGAISAVWAVADKDYTTLTLLVKLDNFDFDQDPTEAVVTVTVGKINYAMNLEGTMTGEYKFNGAVYNADGSDGAAAYYEFQVAINAAESKKAIVAISYGSDKIEKGYIALSDYTAYKTIDYQLDGKDVTCITRVYEAGEDGTLVIPKEINGKPVVHMGDFNDDRVSILGDNPWVKTVRVQNPGEGFEVELRKRVFAFTKLENIIIDSDVVLNNGNTLPEQFAYGSTSLKTVQLPDTIKSFSKEAFRNTPALTTITLPSSLTYIGANCFRQAGLTGDIVIPATVTKIDYAAFYAVTTMSSVTVLNPDCEFITGGGQWDGHPFVATGTASLKGYLDSTLEAFCAANNLSDRFVPLNDYSVIATAKTLGGVLPVGEAVFEDNAPRYYNFVESQTSLSAGAISAVWAVADKNYTTLTLLVKLDNFDFDQDPTEAVVTVTVGKNVYTMDLEGTKTGEFSGALYNADGSDGAAVYYEFQVAINGSENGKVAVSISYGTDKIEKGYITLSAYTAYKTIDYNLNGTDVTCITRVYEAGEDGTLVIPKEINGKPVVHMGDFNDDRVSILGDNPWVKTVRVQNPGEGFEVELRKRVFAFTKLENIIIDSDVVLNNGNTLPEQFAYGSTSLKTVQLPDTIKSFSKEAFRNTPALTTITLPSALTYIGINCFRQAGLTGDIVIPATVTKIDYAAFYAVQTMSSVTVLNPDCEFITGGGQWDGHPFVATGTASLKGYLDSTLEVFCDANNLSDRFVALDSLNDIDKTKTLGGVLPVGEAVFEDNAPRYYNFVESQTSLSAGAISAVWAVADKNYTTLTLLVKLDNFDFDQDPAEAIVTVEVGHGTYALDLEGTKTGDFNGAVYNADGSDGAAAYYEFQVALNALAAKKGKVAVSISYGTDKIEKGYITLSDYTAYKTIPYTMDGKDVTCITRVYEAGEDGTLVIPKQLDGKYVVQLGDYNDDRVSILGDNPWVKTVRVQNPGESLQVELRKRVFAFTMLEKIIIDDDVVLNNGNVLPEQFAYGSTKLQSVELPDTITAFSKEAFRNTPALTTITLPSALTYIGINCFRQAGLTGDIVIPATVTKIDYAAFYAVQTMSSVTVLNPDCEFITGGGQWDGHPFVATGTATLKGYSGSTLETFCTENSLTDRFVAITD